MLRISPCPHLCPEGGPPWAGFGLGGNEITDWVGSTVRHPLGRILLNGAPPPQHSQAAGSNEVAANRSGGFVGTWLGFLRDRTSCWGRLCVCPLCPPHSGCWPCSSLCSASLLLDRALTLPFLETRTACGGGVPRQETSQGPPGMRERYRGYQERALQTPRPREAKYPEAGVMGTGLELVAATVTMLLPPSQSMLQG